MGNMESTPAEALEAEIEKLKETFAKVDVDGSGFITFEELRVYLEAELKHVDADFRAMIMVITGDKDGDGKLSYEELLELVTRTAYNMMTDEEKEQKKKEAVTDFLLPNSTDDVVDGDLDSFTKVLELGLAESSSVSEDGEDPSMTSDPPLVCKGPKIPWHHIWVDSLADLGGTDLPGDKATINLGNHKSFQFFSPENSLWASDAETCSTFGFGGLLENSYYQVNMFRKTEYDWDKVYFCRKEGTSKGYFALLFEFATPITSVNFKVLDYTVFESGSCKIALTSETRSKDQLSANQEVNFELPVTSFMLHFLASGGSTGNEWQHAQFFRANRGGNLDRPNLEFVVTHCTEVNSK